MRGRAASRAGRWPRRVARATLPPTRTATAARVLAALRSVLGFFGLALADVALHFPHGVEPLKWDGRGGEGSDAEAALDKPLAVPGFKRLTRSPGEPLPVVTAKVGGPGCGPLPEAFRAALDALAQKAPGESSAPVR